MCPTFLSLVDFYVPFAAVCSTAGEKEEEEGFLVPLSTRVGFPANYHVYEKCKKYPKSLGNNGHIVFHSSATGEDRK